MVVDMVDEAGLRLCPAALLRGLIIKGGATPTVVIRRVGHDNGCWAAPRHARTQIPSLTCRARTKRWSDVAVRIYSCDVSHQVCRLAFSSLASPLDRLLHKENGNKTSCSCNRPA